MTSLRIVASFSTLLVVLGACRQHTVVPAADPVPGTMPLSQCVPGVRAAPITPSETLSVPLHRGLLSDQIEAMAARVVPGGWGGFTSDGAGGLLVRLVDTTQVEAALTVLRRLAEDPEWRKFSETYDVSRLSTARAVPTKWDAAQIYDWKVYIGQRLSSARPAAGISLRLSWVSLDHFIEYMATDPAAQRRLDEYLSTLELPCGLVRTGSTGPLYSNPGTVKRPGTKDRA